MPLVLLKLLTIVFHEPPLLLEYSMVYTFEVLVAVQVILVVLHPVSVPPPLGDVTVITGADMPIENVLSLISVLHVLMWSVIRTRQLVDVIAGIVQLYVLDVIFWL